MNGPAWWPPKPGSKLRHFTLHGSNGPRDVEQVHALVHVLAVFEHNGEVMATVAEWFPTKCRWHYETIHGWLEAAGGSYWPDGHPPPQEHGKCNACRREVGERDEFYG